MLQESTKTDTEKDVETTQVVSEGKDVSAQVAEPVLNLPPISAAAESLAENTPDTPQESTPVSSTSGQTYMFPDDKPESGEEVFDPNIHAVDENGNPKYTLAGKLSKKRGRKSGKQDASVNPISLPSNDARVIGARQAAIAAVQTLLTIGMMIGGDEWKPGIDETTGVSDVEMLTKAYTDWFLVSGIDNIPPWLGAAIATSSFCLPRFAMPQTQGWIAKNWTRVKGWFGYGIK